MNRFDLALACATAFILWLFLVMPAMRLIDAIVSLIFNGG